jgi:hypothetical protein
MTARRTIILLVFAYLLGLTGGWGIHIKIKPSEEQVVQLQVDAMIRYELCERIQSDINKFKRSPHSFQRSSLKVLISESVETTKTLASAQPKDQPVQFKGTGGSVVSSCQILANQWVKIPTVFPEQFEEELALINPKSKPDFSNTDQIPNSLQVNNNEKRLALVIGNSDYQARPLKNPVNDAQDVGKALKSAGFKVLELYDADLDGMQKSIHNFSELLANYEVGLVYYSGHGIEFSGRNYFIPINANIKSEDEIPRQGFDATEIVEKMTRSNVKTSIFIIDACRNAPVFSKFRSAKSGLTSMQVSNGSIVAFSAAPGQVAIDGNGRNSPYTTSLLRQIQIPNKKIEDVMKETAKFVSESTGGRQVPWYNSSLIGDFYFIKQ